MPWNWELPRWPKFNYNAGKMADLERRFLLGVGGGRAYLKMIGGGEYRKFVVEILSLEGEGSSQL